MNLLIFCPRIKWFRTESRGIPVCAELQRCAQHAIGFLEAAAAARAGGAAAQCRTIAYSGYAGLVTYSMTGDTDTSAPARYDIRGS